MFILDLYLDGLRYVSRLPTEEWILAILTWGFWLLFSLIPILPYLLFMIVFRRPFLTASSLVFLYLSASASALFGLVLFLAPLV